MSNKKQALGRGLNALLEASNIDTTSSDASSYQKITGAIASVAIEQIEINPFQPRAYMDENALMKLTESIQEFGIIQPVTVRKLGYGKYQLISGERRYRAAQKAGLTEIPAYIKVANDPAMLEMALVENIQREDLDAIEIAIAYKRLIEECQLTQDELGKKTGKNRSTITNYLRLLKLPAEIQLGIRTKKITMGHARALINIEDEVTQLVLFHKIVEEELSVRQTETLAKAKIIDFKPRIKKAFVDTVLSFTQQEIQDNLSQHFNTEVILHRNTNGTGKVVIPFSSDDDLDQIVKKIY